MNLNKQDIKDLLTRIAAERIDEIMKKKVVRGGKIKKVRKAKNDAQKSRLTGQSKQQRRASARKSKKEKRKKGTLKPKARTQMKRKKSLRRGKNAIAGRK